MLRQYIFLLFLLFSTSAFAQHFQADIEDLGRYYRLSFTVDDRDAKGFTPPSLSDFEVLSGPSTSTSSSYQIINGKASSSESVSYTYIVAPKRAGRINIGSASVQLGGRTLRSQPIAINASAQHSRSGAQQGGGAARGGAGEADNERLQQAGSRVTQRDLFVDVTPSRTRVKEQEAVLLTYRIHARVGVGLANTTLTHKPDFKGMISQEMPLPGNQIETIVEHRGGTTYRTGTILQYLVFPQQAGELTIPSIQFDCTVIQQDNSLDFVDAFFNSGGRVGVKVVREVAEQKLHVEALPQPKPAGFSGAVGKFSLKGQLLTAAPKTNDVATYRLTLSGVGNMKLIAAPTIAFPTDFDAYEPKTNDQTKATSAGLEGTLTFDYTFVPRNVGHYTIPSTTFVFFDTATGQYRTLRTQPVDLAIAQGEKSRDDVARELQLRDSDIRPNHPAEGAAFSVMPVWGTAAYWALTAFVVGLVLVVWYALRRFIAFTGNTVARRKGGAEKQALRSLKAAKALAEGKDTAAFYAAVQTALTGFVADVANLPTAGLSKQQMHDVLAQKGCNDGDIAAFEKLIDTCEYARFAPSVDGAQSALLDEALAVIQKLAVEK